MPKITRTYKTMCGICKNTTSTDIKNIKKIMCIFCQIQLHNKRLKILSIKT